MNIKKDIFPKNFLFGTATSAYQIEGAANEDGRKPSIWDDFCHQPNRIIDGSSGDIACDHYHRYQEDLDLIKTTNLDAYRFSISWPRVISNRSGKINQAGLDFYQRLTDGLLERNIAPYVTLYHWDLPSYWEEKGGWLNRDTAKAFQEYAVIMAEKLGDRIPHWITHNEMWCASFLSYEIGVMAPGTHDMAKALQAAHNIMLSHGLAIEALRETRSDIKLGIAPNYLPSYPSSDSEEDKRAAHTFDGYFNRWFLDPLKGRGYPQDMVEIFGDMMPEIQSGDMEKMALPLDFIGVNYYNSNWYRHDENGGLFKLKKEQPQGLWLTQDRDVYAKGLYDALMRFHSEYGFDNIYITENGAAFEEQVVVEQGIKRVHDEGRIRFFKEHFVEAAKAIEDGVDLKGFFLWSLMDNFEWPGGYTIRYGMNYVDFETQERIAKDSALWLKDFLDS
ncbi:MAG: GH1 family beta-glucosidase [Spirochaetaceae bacterium]|jgi:beta-glucosidase|nr:GH1 family beta-glucosidase [Spirochaetaceae bacterium]